MQVTPTNVSQVAQVGTGLDIVSLLMPVVQLVVGIIVTIAGGVYIYNYKQSQQQEEMETERLDRVETAVFGVDGVSTMEGVIDVMESNYEQSERNTERIQNLRERVEEVEETYEQLERRLRGLREKAVMRSHTESSRLEAEKGEDNE